MSLINIVLCLISFGAIFSGLCIQIFMRLHNRKIAESYGQVYQLDDGTTVIFDKHCNIRLEKGGKESISVHDSRKSEDGVGTFFCGCVTGFGFAMLSVVCVLLR